LQHICFGTIPGGGLDAYAFRIEDAPAYGVVVPEGLFYLTNLFTKLVVLLQPFTQTREGLVYLPSASFQQYALASHPYIRFRTRDILKAYFLIGEPRAALPYLNAIPFQDRLAYLLVGTELFVLAHEAAHVMLGHLDRSNHNAYTLDLELEADAVALKVLTRFFDETADFGYARASLCGALFLSITHLWESGMKQAFSIAGLQYHSEDHPSFQKRLENFIAGSEHAGHSETPPWYIFIHNAIRIAADLIGKGILTSIIDRAGGITGLSARVLPKSYAHLGRVRSPRENEWSITIGELLVSKDPGERQLGLWFLVKMAPESAIGLYDGITDEDENVNHLCREALCSVEPMYRSYLPRLVERFRETAQADSLLEYKIQISSLLVARAASELEDQSSQYDPMSASSFQSSPESSR
jgi:hypothetical protein